MKCLTQYNGFVVWSKGWKDGPCESECVRVSGGGVDEEYKISEVMKDMYGNYRYEGMGTGLERHRV